MSLIVVGVDHSESAKEALRVAFEEVQLRQAPLRAVHDWQFEVHRRTGHRRLRPVLGAQLSERPVAIVRPRSRRTR